MPDDSPYRSEGIQTPLHVPEPDTINSFAVTGDFGFNHVEGPFAVEKDGTKWTIAVPHDDVLSPSVLKDNEGDGCVLLADCEPVGGGLVETVHDPEGEGELHVVVDQYPRGDE
ncbi:hypothetical protein HTZ84_22235 [Haloterrigena sp. SYSU A558-1]|uniref:Uncharacterized protein n=1 Tax=Haloterrigena gelatinilytica TaxID=2741724 RepID=A0ABX2LQ11_9EURY|nr:hypothetical protein [Haloterrigena gelatinilytica]NUC74986.1 hypothetical protein [Haloterrigena gelatinilytica]